MMHIVNNMMKILTLYLFLATQSHTPIQKDYYDYTIKTYLMI
jgi:hypothetical protein